jgi:hypothetical protein
MRVLIVTTLETSIRLSVVNRAEVRPPDPYHAFGELVSKRSRARSVTAGVSWYALRP